MPLEDFIISVYCLIDEIFQNITKGKPLRKRGFTPKMSDSEIITIEIVGEFLGFDCDKKIWAYFKNHWQAYFPKLGSRSNFAKQASNLFSIKQQIQTQLITEMNAQKDTLHIADGFPIPVCKFKRAYFSRVFKGIADYGHCASKGETYYGFKGNLVINSEGIITNITATPAHYDERESLWEVVNNIEGLVIADKGLIGENFQMQLLNESNINLQTPLRSNMNDQHGKEANDWLVSTRRLVETVIGQLTERFNIQKVRARDLWHFTNRITRKVLSHTIAVFINKAINQNALQFDKLLTI